MNILETFSITGGNCLKLRIPDFKNKDNCYRQPTRSLDWFDVAYMYCHNGLMELEIKKDTLGEIISVFSKTIERALLGKAKLPEHIVLGQVSLAFSTDTENQQEDVDYSNLWLFSTPGSTQTWLYTRDHSLFLEISKIYPFLYVDPEEGEKYISLQEYTKAYKPIAVYEISKEQAQKWIEQCESILTNMDKP